MAAPFLKQRPAPKSEAPRPALAEAQASPMATKGKPRARRLAFYGLGAAGVLGLGGYGVAVAVSPPHVATDDAYVAGDVVAITSREAGAVTALYADNTESVRQGQRLVDLDASTADVNLAAAEAELGRTVRAVRADNARVQASAADIAKASSDLFRAQADLERRQQAVTDGAVSAEDVAHAREAVRAAQAALALARGRHLEAQASVRGVRVSDNPAVLAAAAAVRRAAIVRRHLSVSAPVDGVVAQRTVQLGQQVAPGTPLMAIVPLRRVWVDANVRETQLADIRVGQPVRVIADAYGRQRVFHGRVEGLPAGSGNAFALLPPQNASGNWIKITQRLSVRIALDQAELARRPLQIGLSVTARIDTRDRSGPILASTLPVALAAQAPEDAGPAVETRIARIIAENRG